MRNLIFVSAVLLLYVILALLSGCAARSPIVNNTEDPFAAAQVALVYRTEGQSLHVENDWSVEVVPSKRISCHGRTAIGCAFADRKLILVTSAFGPQVLYLVLMHEYMHMILYEVGDKGWISWLDETISKGGEK
jgi:hypothetical protein